MPLFFVSPRLKVSMPFKSNYKIILMALGSGFSRVILQNINTLSILYKSESYHLIQGALLIAIYPFKDGRGAGRGKFYQNFLMKNLLSLNVSLLINQIDMHILYIS